MAASKDAILSAAKKFLTYVNKSPSPYHAVEECQVQLLAAGFKELKEADAWDIKPMDKCFVTKNKSTVIAFAVGGNFIPGNGFSIVGAHTDSPCLKVKPVSKKVRHGYVQVGVQCYGGGIWNTWFDRDLTVAGRCIVKDGYRMQHRLIHVDRPILRVPNICIHLQRDMNDKFGPNKESHIVPVIATAAQEELNNSGKSPCAADLSDHGNLSQADKHHPVLIDLLCKEMDIKPEQLLDFELCLTDTQPGAIGGAYNEFIFAPRLDNLVNAYCALEGLIKSLEGESLSKDSNIRMISLFDNEEIGSQSAQGAASMLQENVLRRLSIGGSPTAFEESIPKSLMVSADQAHAVHPNYSEKHEDSHKPGLHKGIVVKINANNKYATTAVTTSIMREIANKAEVPLQDFVVRNDSTCGSTIGPIMSARLGMATIDIGGPQLSMHSIREMCCTSSILQNIKLFTTFFDKYPEVYSSLDF